MSAVRTPRVGEVWAQGGDVVEVVFVCGEELCLRYASGLAVWFGIESFVKCHKAPAEPWENPQPVEMWGWVGQEGSIYTVTTYPPSAKSRDLFAICQVTVTPIPGTVEKL